MMKTVAMAMSKRPLPDVKTADVFAQMLVNPIAAASPTCAVPPTIVPTSNTTMLISVVNCTIQLQRTSCQPLASSSCSTLMLFFNIYLAILRKKRRRLQKQDEDKSVEEGKQSEVQCEEEEDEDKSKEGGEEDSEARNHSTFHQRPPVTRARDS
jgi:hypothetical protein